jgi:hypothetical protein
VNRERQRPRPHHPQPVPGTDAELEGMRVIERPDGFYVQLAADGREVGPYESLVEAIEDQRAMDADEIEPGETLAEAEAELGMSDWIDPETSALAEDHVPRLEEH